MSNYRLAVAACSLIGGALIASQASATTIDFSDLASGTALNTQYSALGVTFDGGTVGTCDTGCPVPNINGNFAYGDTFTAIFSTLQNQVSFQSVSFSSTLAEAFDISGNFLTSVSDDEEFPVSNTVNYLNATGISRIVFSYNGGEIGPAITNLTFDGTAAVPEPTSWAMMIGGVGFAGGALRRRRGSVSTTVRFA